MSGESRTYEISSLFVHINIVHSASFSELDLVAIKKAVHAWIQTVLSEGVQLFFCFVFH